MIYIVFGVSGSGKSTIGKLLADKLDMRHIDADDYHSPSSIEKMQNGEALTDEDRLPWLQTLAGEVHRRSLENGVVLSCSALKEQYRKLFNSLVNDIQWIFLDGNKELIKERLSGRTEHFFDISLLDSQFNDLEVPDYAISVSIEQTPKQVVDGILRQVVHG